MAQKRGYGIEVQWFPHIVNRKCVYVDKTAYVYKLAHSEDLRRVTFTLGFPNAEVREGYKSLIGKELPQEMRKRIALCVTLYFEDVICDSGIWRSFVGVT